MLGGAAGAYRLLVRGDLTLDVGVGRSKQPLGPLIRHIAAPYLGRTPRALRHELDVWVRGTDMVLAAHHTPVRKAIATTLETVRFERPTLVEFRLVRGPVPHLAESFQLEPEDGETQLTWAGELGTDFWRVGRWWGELVAHKWRAAVKQSFDGIATEAERRAALPTERRSD